MTEIAPRKGRKYNFPALYFEVTRNCNLSCPMCMTGCNDKAFVRRQRARELSTEEIISLVLVPARRDLGVFQVGFSGGEFLLRPDALELVRAAAGMGYEVKITSNATLLTPMLLRELKQAAKGRLVMAFGINSVGDADLNRETRDEGLDTTMRALDLCKQLGVTRHVVVTVGRFNAESLEQTFDWLQRNRIPFNRSPFTARNSGRPFLDARGLDAEVMERYLHPAIRGRLGGYISYTPIFLSPELHARISGGDRRNVTVPQNPSIGCWCGTWIAVSPEGDVSPCAILLDEVVSGNVREMPLEGIVDTSPSFQQILDRGNLKGRCGRCRYKYTCGGCRAMAWFHHGDYLAEDPTCFFDPVDESTVSPHEEQTNRVFRHYVRLAALAGMYERPEQRS